MSERLPKAMGGSRQADDKEHCKWGRRPAAPVGSAVVLLLCTAAIIVAQPHTYVSGLIRESDGIKAYGAGMLSSCAETAFSVDDPSPNRIGFDLARVMRTAYRIDDFQQTYFVLESFGELFRALQQDLRPLYERVRALPEYAPDSVLPTDRVFTRGTGAWKRRKAG